MKFDEFKKQFIEWSIANIEKKNICPYAQSARINNKIDFLLPTDNFNFTDNDKIYVVWCDNKIDNILLTFLTLKFNDDWIVLKSTPTSGLFVKNFTNCIFIQNRKDMEIKRNILKKTVYYNNWPENYFNEIMKK
jgi:hypothetical protein